VKTLNKLISLVRDERGQGMAEYGLIIALIAIVVIIALTTLGGNLKKKFDHISKTLK
jgi:pilus assembly protein Flp/PilA